MRRRIAILIAFIGMVGLLGLNPAVQATHDGGGPNPKDTGKHEGRPTPPIIDGENIIANCVVLGTVSIGNSRAIGFTGGFTADEVNHNHYRFWDTTIPCASDNPAFNSGFRVDAAGGTDGPSANAVQAGIHGESDAEGWSHGDCYAGSCTSFWGDKGTTFTDLYLGTNVNPAGSGQCTNCGEISIAGANGTESQGMAATDNWVKFHRVGNQVVAWGVLHVTAGIKEGTIACFLTNLNFMPVNLFDSDGLGLPKDKVDAAILSGDAVVWNAKGDKTTCAGTKGEK